MCAPYFVKEHFSVKMLLFFFIFIHSKREQKKSSPVIRLTVLPFRHYYLTVAIINNVQNVRLQRRPKLTDDASICWWRGSQQTGPVRTARRSDARAARRRPWLCCGTHAACPVLYISFWFRQCQNYWKSVKSCSKMYTATFYEPQQKCRF